MVDKKILITGSTGFLGEHLVKYFQNKGYEVIEINHKGFIYLSHGNIPGEPPLTKVDYIIHCAVKTEPGNYCRTKQGEQFLINTEITNTILNYWKNYQPQAKFITFGSSCAYDPDVIKSEDNYLKGECEPGYETYGMIKRYLYQGLKALNQQYGMKFSCLIPSLIYGPGFHIGDRHFIYDVLNKLIDAKKTGVSPILWGDGYQRRELIYIDDALNIIEKSLTWDHQLVNLSSGQEYSIRMYAAFICNIIGYDFELIQWDTNAFVGARSKNLINTYLHDPTLFTPHKIGLEKTIEYYLSQK